MADFSNFINLKGGDKASVKTYIRKEPVMLWYTYGGITSSNFPGEIHHWHRLCSLNSVDAPSAELINETETQQLGKTALSTNDGTKWTTSLEFDGGDALTVAAMLGQHMGNTDNGANTNVLYDSVLQLGSDEGVKGALMFADIDTNGNLFNCQLLTECSVKLTSAPGATVGTDDTFTVEIESRGEMFMAAKGCIFVPFMFYDNGSTITNASAPDGTLTAFEVKDANGAFTTVPSYDLQFQRVRKSLSGGTSPEQYIIGLRNGGTAVSASSYSATQNNATITFNTAPSDGAKIEGICCMATGFGTWAAGTYFPGDIVYHTGQAGYFKVSSSTVTTEEPSASPTDWTLLTNQQFPVPYITDADGASFTTSGTREWPLYSWLNVQRTSN